MGIKEQILNDLREAMKSKQSDRLRVLRSLKAALEEKEISERKGGVGTITEEQAVEVLMKAAKQRKESIEQFNRGGRSDLADSEAEELQIIEAYLPEMMDEEAVRQAVVEKIRTTGATGPADMGKVMGSLMGELKGKAEGALVSRLVKEELSSL